MTSTQEEIYFEKHMRNKREAFDGMRAYHLSEIEHKKDAVEMIKTILTVTILVYGGMLGMIISGKVPLAFFSSLCLALLLFCTVCFISYKIVSVTNLKISKDNARYRKYAEEYVKERDILELDADLQLQDYCSAWKEVKDLNKTGFYFTKSILSVFAGLPIIISIIGSVFIVYVSNLL
ncbi:hypothetical protein QUH73_04935 [Labilibaculum sp. K2S]|uniref:hypothetical protein n=1 Tax=Labilibaculum sp. K2S TaxID=3056386 RepID=UPI0025A33E2C|nr:hypothetical protein [Labilibaculum sp. K2S]MDM8159161.1 hypothetical protein [Labilibaculum sp. K2S]